MRCASLCSVVAEQPRLRSRAGRAGPCVCRVSSQSTRSASAQLAQDAQRDVLEVPDRRRADRERHASCLVERLEREQPGADQPGVRAELGRDDPEARRGRSPAAPRGAPPRAPRGKRKLAAAVPKPPPTTTSSGPKMLTSEPIAGAEEVADPGERLERVRRRPPRRGRRAARRSRPRPRALSAARSAAFPEASALEVAAAGAVALARRAVGDDDDVAELGPAAVERAAEDERRRRRRCRA